MSALVWLLAPVGVTVLAAALVTWLNRPRSPVDRYEQVQQFHRFQEAMEMMENGGAARREPGEAKPITRAGE